MTAAERKDDPVPSFLFADAALIATELGHATIARLLSETAGNRAAQRLAKLAVAVRPGKLRTRAARFAAFAGGRPGLPRPEIYARDNTAIHLRQRTIYARLKADPHWRPRELVVTGSNHVETARAAGRAVVFWLMPLELNVILFRIACRDAGWRFSFMSHWQHGPAQSRFGARVVDASDCRMEERFGPRLVMSERDTHSALGQAARVLRGGGMVGFRGISWTERPVRYPLLDGDLDLALGAPVLAQRAGAELLSVSCRVDGDAMALHIEPLAADRSRPPAEIGAEFAARFEKAVLDCPAVWTVSSKQWRPGPDPRTHDQTPSSALRRGSPKNAR